MVDHVTDHATRIHNAAVKKKAADKSKKKSCQTKKTYPTIHAAHYSVAKQHKKGIYLKPYACDRCGLFHLTRRTKENVLADLFKKIEQERRTGFYAF